MRRRVVSNILVLASFVFVLAAPQPLGGLPADPGEASPDAIFCPKADGCCWMNCVSGHWYAHTRTCGSPADGSCEFCEYKCLKDGPPTPTYPL